MQTSLALLSGFLVAVAVWLILSGNLLRLLFGLLVMSNGINVAIFAAGRLTTGVPPLLGAGGAAPDATMANALPQALLLTAIVIGFGLFAFALALALRAHRALGHVELDEMRAAEPRDEP